MIDYINKLSRIKRSFIIIISDVLIALFSLLILINIHENLIVIIKFLGFIPVIISIVTCVSASAYILGINKVALRGFGLNDLSLLFFYAFLSSCLFYISIFFLFISFSEVNVAMKLGFSRIIIIFAPVLFIGILFSRIFAIYLIKNINLRDNPIKKVIIYGAGNAGIQLMRSYEKESDIKFLCFIDQNPNLRNAVISGIKTYSRKDFEKSSIKNLVDEIWIAIPSLEIHELENIINYLSKFSKKVLSLPEINNLRFNTNFKNRLSEANINNFLGRETIDINTDLYLNSYKGKNVLVSGAGGSIGSELCLQIINSNPKKLILFELNELALYNIEKKIKDSQNSNGIEIIACLGSINDKFRIHSIFDEHQVNIIFHAAAYKHVHLVETNIIEGFKNNVLGTYNLIQCVQKFPIERFVLVSSDKAVRPTNIMGATKRLTEIIIQSVANLNKDINFSIVRFGNVIGSSGSVIPLFMNQINSGGPVTITDAEMTRYFMAISEAAKLILIAGSYGTNGEIYLLDMGKPIKIIDLAKNMIFLSGNKLKLNSSVDEGIEIKIINKRPGEKITEELLIDGKINKTKHHKVVVLDETKDIDFPLNQVIVDIEEAVEKQDKNLILELLNSYLKDYNPIEQVID